ncbi:hypothetical protein ACHAWX_003916 [Stephanocyclus meneghinianus]
MPTLATHLALTAWALSILKTVEPSKSICNANCTIDSSGNEFCKFTANVDLFASELGYFRFLECGDVPNPTLGIELGKTYQFIQADPSNHMHPLGFAYYPDGDHAGLDELEPGIVPPGSSSNCSTDLLCPAPMYHLNDQYLGTYPNFDVENSGMDHYAHFGLDEYESMFQHPITEWIRYGQFSAYLTFDSDTDYDNDIFYFCHIHEFMAGRIKLLKNGFPIQESDVPELGYEYETPTGHDSICGSYGLNGFQLPHPECPQKFVCDTEGQDVVLQQFSQCIDSMNCAMIAGMTSSVQGGMDEIALFIHQMIPHHQNAVNMAKALLRTGRVKCDNLTDEESEQAPDCAMEIILREIISGQNAQIQVMRGILEAKSFPQTNDCTVTVDESYATETRGIPSLQFASASAAETATTSVAAAMSDSHTLGVTLLTGLLVAFKALAEF